MCSVYVSDKGFDYLNVFVVKSPAACFDCKLAKLKKNIISLLIFSIYLFDDTFWLNLNFDVISRRCGLKKETWQLLPTVS